MDIRSTPYSRWVPHFNRKNFLELASERAFIYEWWGDKLGGKISPNDDIFSKAIAELAERFGEGPSSMTGIIVCAERDPKDCHRATSIGPAIRSLPYNAIDVLHILADGSVIAQSELEEKGQVPRCDRAGTLDLFSSK